MSAGETSIVESFMLTGENIRRDVRLSTESPFAISTSSDGFFGQTLTLESEGFELGPTIFAIYEPDAADEGDFDGEITHSTEGGEDLIISFSGTSVAESSEPEPEARLLVKDEVEDQEIYFQ